MSSTNETVLPSEIEVKSNPIRRAKTLGELLRKYQAPKLRHGQQWGDWRFDAHRLTLDYAPEGIWRYELDLERNHDAASILDFIFQFHGKVWGDAQTMKDLLDALHDVFDPQGNLSSCGRNKRLPKRFVAGLIEPPTDAEREASSRSAFEANAAWLGTAATMRLLNGHGCGDGNEAEG